MKRILTILIIIGAGFSAAYSRQVSDQERQKNIDAREYDNRTRAQETPRRILKDADALRLSSQERRILLGRWRYKTLPRKLTKENLEYLKPALADFKKYESFLSQPDTGLIKLLPDIGCGKNLVIDASSPCVMNASIPGDGSAYSFRKNTYEEVELSDLLFKDGKFQIEGFMTQGILVKLGALPIETISLNSKGMSFLTDFIPAKKVEDVAAQRTRLKNGVTADDLIYSTEQPLAENMTYGLRSIAYRGTGTFDNRRDIIIAFQVVRVNSDGSTVIVWKKLRDIESPKMKKKRYIY
jgi:hypothetical protein